MAKRGRPRKTYRMLSREITHRLELIEQNAQDSRARLAEKTREWLRATLKNFRREAARARDPWERWRVQQMFTDATVLAELLKQFQDLGYAERTQQDIVDFLFLDDLVQRAKDEAEQEAASYREVVEYQPEEGL